MLIQSYVARLNVDEVLVAKEDGSSEYQHNVTAIYLQQVGETGQYVKKQQMWVTPGKNGAAVFPPTNL